MMEETGRPEAVGNSGSLIDAEGVKKLSSGLLVLYKPELESVRKQLLEFTRKQETLLEQLESENKNFQDVMETTELHEIMATVKACHARLTYIKREMTLIHERTARLKKRAMRLQQTKQREALLRTHQREERLLQEQSLIAEPMRSASSKTKAEGESVCSDISSSSISSQIVE